MSSSRNCSVNTVLDLETMGKNSLHRDVFENVSYNFVTTMSDGPLEDFRLFVVHWLLPWDVDRGCSHDRKSLGVEALIRMRYLAKIY